MYDFTCQLATFEPPPPHMQQLFAALHGNQVVNSIGTGKVRREWINLLVLNKEGVWGGG